MASRFTAAPLTADTWGDLETLFDRPGGSIVRGCWCMYYRLTGSVEVSARAGVVHKTEMCELVGGGTIPGLVGYLDDSPAGWISLGPRADYARLARSRIMKPVDHTPDFMFFGSRSLYERAGFREVVRRSPTRVVMRRGLRPRRVVSP